jgi:hypothetical protein
MSERESFQTDDATAAEQYRLMQAAELLRDAGFVQSPDGSWELADE